jgi:hypothetical protein
MRSSSATAGIADEIGTPEPKLGFEAHPSRRRPGVDSCVTLRARQPFLGTKDGERSIA